MKSIHKRYIVLALVVLVVVVIIWKMYPSFAHMEVGYEGNNIVTGRNWGVNITEISNIEKKGEAILLSNVDSIGTTLNFNVSLFKPGDEVSFDITVTNTGKLNAELYAMTLAGVSPLDGEAIDYEILPLDYIEVHTDKQTGSIIKANESQSFHLSVKYSDRVAQGVNREYNLGLGSTIIYKQK